jgi:hypothetical protein
MDKNLRKKIIATEKEHFKNFSLNPVSAGDLTSETGKSYMKGLFKCIDEHSKLKKDRLWFLVKINKEQTNQRIIKITYGVVDKPLHYLRENMDMWEYNYKKESLQLKWSIPHRVEMKNFLRSPEKYSAELIRWIKKYIKQEKINLEDKSAVAIIKK